MTRWSAPLSSMSQIPSLGKTSQEPVQRGGSYRSTEQWAPLELMSSIVLSVEELISLRFERPSVPSPTRYTRDVACRGIAPVARLSARSRMSSLSSVTVWRIALGVMRVVRMRSSIPASR